MMHGKPNAQPNRSLIDGIATLQALATSPEPIGNRELARRLGFDPTRVNRLLKTLAYLGIARQTANRKYTSGPGMHVLAAQSLFASGLMHNALPALEGLRKFDLTVALGVLWHDTVSYLFHAPPGLELSRGLGRIGLLPATSSGIGMTLLAQAGPAQIDELYAGRDIPSFPGGINELNDKLEEIRQRTYARVVVGADDRHTVAVGVGRPAFAAVALSGWIPEEATPRIVIALQEAAEHIGQS
ncbi:IclR family transcriptional regulator [Sphingomonas sp. 37zxx]|uniref:IclR family transcriptional regulator n=1 Tax=Sphingomonas sp. 37zxx TaxID=1550073 RepID=UPI000B0C002B|nr:helix-turn-helix domain-containing protein [Sphingomonas sp. 37zxx]